MRGQKSLPLQIINNLFVNLALRNNLLLAPSLVGPLKSQCNTARSWYHEELEEEGKCSASSSHILHGIFKLDLREMSLSVHAIALNLFMVVIAIP